MIQHTSTGGFLHDLFRAFGERLFPSLERDDDLVFRSGRPEPLRVCFHGYAGGHGLRAGRMGLRPASDWRDACDH